MKAALANGAGAPSIAIVGAGPGGLAMAARLKSAGLSTVALFEKGTQVGGTWFDNHYPGAACDVPAYLYSFSFGPQAHWSRKYPTQPEILEYFETFAAHFDLSEHVHLETEVLGATWDQDRLCWTVNLKDLREGSVRSEDFDIVINAVGQLSRPAIPSIPGLAERTAPVMSSAMGQARCSSSRLWLSRQSRWSFSNEAPTGYFQRTIERSLRLNSLVFEDFQRLGACTDGGSIGVSNFALP
jgi:cation diffusion facilitator CzcD-associated flavoprotein CzcO